MKFRHIFFDLDNTLWDHRRNSILCIEQLFKENAISEKYSLSFKDFYATYYHINEQLWADLRDGIIDKQYLRKNRFLKSFAHFQIHDEKLAAHFEENFLDKVVNFNELLPYAKEILEYLTAKSYHIHILSNGFKEVTHHKIKASGIAPYISSITSADEINVRKPDPKIFEYSLKKANAKKEESLFVGDDWIADIEGALHFGMEVVYYNVLNETSNQTQVTEILHLQQLKNLL